MTPNEYLAKVLSAQTFDADSAELKDLQARRAEVEQHLRSHFAESSPTIRYGGSKAKGTMIKECYDLDIVCYFEHDDSGGGETLEDIYNNVCRALEDEYLIEKKSSAVRLKDASAEKHGADFHIDVVPGRFTDAEQADAFLYISSGEKRRLKTNLDVHIAHVKGSGVIDAIRLMKLWKARNRLGVRNFILELTVIELLKSKKTAGIADQVEHVLKQLRDNIDDIVIKDPANPEGNDLSRLFADASQALSSDASRTLDLIRDSSWEAVFGEIDEDDRTARTAALRRAAAVSTPSRAWCRDA